MAAINHIAMRALGGIIVPPLVENFTCNCNEWLIVQGLEDNSKLLHSEYWS
jgi:hypothetical protein